MEDRRAIDLDKAVAGLRQISRGFAALADALSASPAGQSQEERYRAVMTEWGKKGLTRADASALFRKYGFAPQASGGWVRGDWLETRPDGLRYLTPRSHEWLQQQEGAP